MNNTPDPSLLDAARERFRQHYRMEPTVAAYAPGRVEILGNHTDYNEGLVLSAAINRGTVFLCAPGASQTCRVVAGDLMQETQFPCLNPTPDAAHSWVNYVMGVVAGLFPETPPETGFNGLFFSNIPMGSGLSSSAALELSAALALCGYYQIQRDPMDLARIAQQAEHCYAGVKCGLMDQISSLYGKPDALVMTDFRSLQIDHVPFHGNVCFLLCNTNAKHALVDGAYNERRQACETAAHYFAEVLSHPVAALRDVSMEEWREHHHGMDPLIARRAAHPIGENERVIAASQVLQKQEFAAFGDLMFASHESSIVQFENSCPELDFVVACCRSAAGVLGARLSGGGFGGSTVILVEQAAAEETAAMLGSRYSAQFGQPCDLSHITPSSGATPIALPGNP